MGFIKNFFSVTFFFFCCIICFPYYVYGLWKDGELRRGKNYGEEKDYN